MMLLKRQLFVYTFILGLSPALVYASPPTPDLNLNLNGAFSDADSRSNSHSKSDAKAFSGASSDSTSIGVNHSSNDNSNAISNDNASSAVSGDSHSASDSASNSGSDNDINISRTEAERPVHSAAPIFSVGCQVAASAQGREVGVSMIVDDAACQFLKLADAEYQMYSIARTPVEKEYHWQRLNTFLHEAEGAIQRTADTNLYAKNGMNVGLGTLGFGVFGYIIKLAVMAF